MEPEDEKTIEDLLDTVSIGTTSDNLYASSDGSWLTPNAQGPVGDALIEIQRTQSHNIVFNLPDSETPVLKLEENGDIYVRGKLVENDKDVVDALRDFLHGTGNLDPVDTELKRAGLGGLI